MDGGEWRMKGAVSGGEGWPLCCQISTRRVGRLLKHVLQISNIKIQVFNVWDATLTAHFISYINNFSSKNEPYDLIFKRALNSMPIHTL